MSLFMFFLSPVLDEAKNAATHNISNNFRLKRVGWAFFLFGFLFLFLLRNRRTLLRFIRINKRIWQARSKLILIYIFGLIKHFATTLLAVLWIGRWILFRVFLIVFWTLVALLHFLQNRHLLRSNISKLLFWGLIGSVLESWVVLNIVSELLRVVMFVFVLSFVLAKNYVYVPSCPWEVI